MDDEQKKALAERSNHIGVDLSALGNKSESFHYIGDNPFIQDVSGPVPGINQPFGPNTILSGGGMIKTDVEMALVHAHKDIAALKAQINMMHESLALMNEKLNNYLKYEKRSLGNKSPDGTEQSVPVQGLQRAGSGEDIDRAAGGESK